jgi:hypothetical protein
MPPRRQHRPDPETNTAPDVIEDDLRRRDQTDVPDSMPPASERGEEPAGGGFTPRADGGNPQHPVHDEDQEDAEPADYEREIDRRDGAVDKQIV